MAIPRRGPCGPHFGGCKPVHLPFQESTKYRPVILRGNQRPEPAFRKLKVQGGSVRAIRKLKLLYRLPRVNEPRAAERTPSGWLSQAPPRATRREQLPPSIQAELSVGAPA
jgi:hypothetical protein